MWMEPAKAINSKNTRLTSVKGLYSAPNSWNLTRLGKIDNITEELKDIWVKATCRLCCDLVRKNSHPITIYLPPASGAPKQDI